MTQQRDPDERLAERRATTIRREETSTWRLPSIVGIIFLLLVGLIAYNMYSGNSMGPASVRPSAQAPAERAPGATPSAPVTPPATPPAN